MGNSESERHIKRVRSACERLAGTTEKLSHGQPTFFINKRVYASLAVNHHSDGHVAIWIPVAPGLQGFLIQQSPHKFFRPPYVGVKGWVGVELAEVDDEELFCLLKDAWKLISHGQKLKRCD